MKKCERCNVQYSDFDSYCMKCGSKLKPIKPSTGRKEFPVGELISLIAQVGELETGMDGVMKSIDEIRNLELADEITQLSRHANTIERLVRTQKEHSKSIGEIGKLARLREGDMTALASTTGELENAVQDIRKELIMLRKTDLPDDIVRIGVHEKAIKELDRKMLRYNAEIRTVIKGVLKEVTGRIDKGSNLTKKEAVSMVSAVNRLEESVGSLRKDISDVQESTQKMANIHTKLDLMKLNKYTPTDLLNQSQKEFSAVKSDMGKLAQEITKMNLQKGISPGDFGKLKTDVNAFGKELNNFIREIKRNREGIRELMYEKEGAKALKSEMEKKLNLALRNVSEGVSEVTKAHGEIKRTGVENVPAQIDTLHGRVRELETKHADTDVLHDRIKRLEEQLSSYKRSLPTVIE